jgi:hypothetical protein
MIIRSVRDYIATSPLLILLVIHFSMIELKTLILTDYRGKVVCALCEDEGATCGYFDEESDQ